MDYPKVERRIPAWKLHLSTSVISEHARRAVAALKSGTVTRRTIMVAATSQIGYLSPACRAIVPVNRLRVIDNWTEENRPLTEEDVRIHAWLNERLAILERERRGLLPTIRRMFGSLRPR
jgi:hypothetical protein